ncbi:lipase [Lentinus tigrinus ALCF2SS1-7]|uniref:Lipase n=1 Tax=Lentinus tigrinus ALCF2SS1-6 TaxID=1328759 RepID=A0A5C2S5P3_9APHY|nr:lipase [Lentinus tigrinus ALCF2SS1-6]RPD73434.1 lipase [Lentinus tigrinus ALCF2SS1-7]
MTATITLWAVILAVVSVVFAIPASIPRDKDTSRTSSVSQVEVHSFKPYTFYAASAYCLPTTTIDWSCGQNCAANPNFIPVAAGGDGSFTQYWFVGYDPELDEVIVSHQGTDVLAIVPVLTDGDTASLPLNPQLFPGVDPSVLVHDGFASEQAATSQSVLTAVINATAAFGTNKITTVGHSLGAAISLLDAIYLHLQVPTAQVRFVGYGSPRVGTATFVDWVDTLPIEVNHIANKKDLVPILPPMLLGFHQISGEIHIDELNQWINCPGHDNPSSLCTAGDVDLVLNFQLSDHAGPYDGVMMEFCPT